MALAHAIMTALIDDEMSGYELARSFDDSLGFFWQASHQQIYQELHRLAEKRLLKRREIHQSGKPDKIIYSITARGRQTLQDWVYGESRVQPGKDDLLIKLCNLSEANASHLMEALRQRRDQTMQRLYLYEKIIRSMYADPESLPTRRKGVYLALLAGVSQGEQYLQWCDDALQLLAAVAD